MTATILRLLIFITATLWLIPAQASQWSGIQGEVVSVETNYTGKTLSLTCFGKSWPLKDLGNGRWHGWIGIDLKKDTGNHNIMWRSGKNIIANDFLNVQKGVFRISRIEVASKMASLSQDILPRYWREVKALKATYVEKVSANPDIIMHGKPIEGIESTPFGAQRIVNGKPKSPHSGIDIAAPAGTVIVSPLAGRVLLVADMYLNGKTVAIGHGNGLVSIFSHMQSTAVKQGDWIETRQKIGQVGATGRATGPHLHWGVRFNTARVNPASMLQILKH
ncbi:MAG: M23 family metallopeptidase [Mariprofundus sp.]|nr:M23 family metallopeptidase [Mariprofundus sp.]